MDAKGQGAHANLESGFAASLSPDHKADLIRDVYRKHATELVAIDDAQQKMMLMLLAVLGAGASLLASEKAPDLSGLAKVGLGLLALGLTLVGWYDTARRNKARRSVRELLTQCEKALGLYQDNVFIPDKPVYHPGLLGFARKGWWLALSYLVVLLAGAGFFLVLASK